jgi:hypothetical protein
MEEPCKICNKDYSKDVSPYHHRCSYEVRLSIGDTQYLCERIYNLNRVDFFIINHERMSYLFGLYIKSNEVPDIDWYIKQIKYSNF